MNAVLLRVQAHDHLVRRGGGGELTVRTKDRGAAVLHVRHHFHGRRRDLGKGRVEVCGSQALAQTLRSPERRFVAQQAPQALRAGRCSHQLGWVPALYFLLQAWCGCED